MSVERDQANIIRSLIEHKAWLNEEVERLRGVVAVLWDNHYRADAAYFLTEEQKALAERVAAEVDWEDRS